MPFISSIRRNYKAISDQQASGTAQPQFEVTSNADEIVTAGGYVMHIFKNAGEYKLNVKEISKS
jgi:hypothetical protein